MTTQTEVLKMALEALDQLTNAADTFSVSGVYFNEEVWAKKCLSDAYFAINAIEQTLAQQSNEQVEPIKFPRNVQEYDKDWIIDPAFISRVKHSIDPETPWDFTPTMEQVEATLLALEVIPSTLFAHPPVPTAQHKEPEQEPVGEAYLCEACNTPFDGAYECPSCGHNTAVKEPVYTTPPQRKPLLFNEYYRLWLNGSIAISFNDFTAVVKLTEAAHGIKE